MSTYVNGCGGSGSREWTMLPVTVSNPLPNESHSASSWDEYTSVVTAAIKQQLGYDSYNEWMLQQKLPETNDIYFGCSGIATKSAVDEFLASLQTTLTCYLQYTSYYNGGPTAWIMMVRGYLEQEGSQYRYYCTHWQFARNGTIYAR